jgi:hypothetical protein
MRFTGNTRCVSTWIHVGAGTYHSSASFAGLLAAKYELTTDEMHAILSYLPSYNESRNNLERFLGAATRNGLVECVGLDRWRLAEQLE